MAVIGLKSGTPQLRGEALMGGGRDWLERFTAAYGANILRSALPAVLRYGVVTAEELGLDTCDRRYQDEVLDQGGIVQWLPSVGAWAQKRKKRTSSMIAPERMSVHARPQPGHRANLPMHHDLPVRGTFVHLSSVGSARRRRTVPELSR